jgi:phosphate transport system substrate-binding protein
MKKVFCLVLALAVSMVLLAGCGSQQSAATPDSSAGSEAPAASTEQTSVSGVVTASGSSALQPLAQAAADAFNKANPDCSVTVNGGGSGTGLQQVADGAVDIGDSDVFAEEKLDASAASGLVDHKVCTVTMAAIVNKDLGVSSLTKQQLIDIFTAKVTNWKDVGGPDLAILLVTRPSSSGTRALFKTWALDGAEEASNTSLETDDSGTLLQTVKSNKGAIGYVALSYLVNDDTVQAVAIDGVAPTLENTYNGTYPVWGFEHMYTKGDGSEAAQAFINYMMGDEFASSIESMGYGASSKMSSQAVASHNG